MIPKPTKDRFILHSDLNCFFASVATVLEPRYRGLPIAVCGDSEQRHGIVLAKSEAAKKMGVKTGMVTWQAKQLCPDLISVPPEYEAYEKFSRLTRCIYARYTDYIEAFGIDECWLDISNIANNITSATEIANEIRNAVREELGLTVSIGVSFNKTFAKLGSDIKKPDAVTAIPYESFKEIVWPLPVESMLGVGRSTQQKLSTFGVHTIGELAAIPLDLLEYKFGKIGTGLWLCANGLDTSPVVQKDFLYPIKSVGHGSTVAKDLTSNQQVWHLMLALSQEIGAKLRKHEKLARGIAVDIKTNDFVHFSWQTQLSAPTDNTQTIAYEAYQLFLERYRWQTPIRSVTVRAINLTEADTPTQLDVFTDSSQRVREEKLGRVIDGLRDKYGDGIIRNAVLLENMYPDDEQ
ncbi:MAG: DNA polymerase IV [Clostridia bacterium]|nr:DNA polymerase IV [Clostridia bacterium]